MHNLTPDRSSSAGAALLSANAICMASMMFWAAGFPAAEILLVTWPPLALAVARLLVGVLALLAVWALLEGPGAILRARWGRATVVGGIGFGLGSFLLLLGQSIADPVAVAIVATTLPVLAAGLEIVLDGRRLRPLFALGAVTTVVGGVVASGGTPGEGAALGAGLALAATMLFAWGSRGAVVEFPDLTTMGRTTLTLAGGLLVLGSIFIVARALGLAEGPSAPFDMRQAGALALFALGAMALSQLLWLTGVARLGVSVAALHVNLAPFYVMIFLLALGGSWNGQQALGAGIVALGVVLAQLRR